MPKSMELVQRLLSLNKPYFTLAGLEKVRGQSRPSLYVTLNRLVSHCVLVRLRRGVYQVALRSPALARIRSTPSVPDSATQDQSDGCCAELRQRLRLRSRRTTRTAGRYARYGCSAVADGPLRPGRPMPPGSPGERRSKSRRSASASLATTAARDGQQSDYHRASQPS